MYERLDERTFTKSLTDGLVLVRGSGVPIWVQIRDQLRALVLSGQIEQGATLPGEQELAKRWRVSRTTVRAALAALDREGLLHRAQGVGTTVRFTRFHHELKGLQGFSEDIRARGMIPSSRILSIGECEPPPEAARALQLVEGSKAIYVRRLRLADQTPAGIHEAYLAPGTIDWKQVDENTSLYSLMDQSGIDLAFADETLEAVAASRRDAELLLVPKGTPLLLVTRTTYEQSGRPVEFVKARYRADVYRYTVRLTGKATR